MPANTPKGFPYPLGTDRVMDGDDAIHNLASAVDTKLGLAASGVTTITPSAANILTSVGVTFPTGRFTDVPSIVGQAVTTSADTVDVRVSGATATGFTLSLRRSSATATGIYWIALQNV